MDEYYGYTPGTTMTIESKQIPDLDLTDIDDECTSFSVWRKTFRISMMLNKNDVLLVMIINKRFIMFYMKMPMLKISIIMKYKIYKLLL